ncbi:MAG: hypothetical protein K2O18_19375 [Oscillospiraceae bacterium]|nr:hypothetical protein [Oscillospiraceae bacterium]
MNPQELSALESELGPVCSAEQVCPGVYFLSVKHGQEPLAREYYAVSENSVLSQAAQAYGEKRAGFRLFPLDNDTGGWRIVQYEAAKYRAVHRLPLDEPLRDTAVFAAEHHPEYFGTYPVPVQTPEGRTLRHKALDNGIFWIETDRCRELLAVCYPIWSTELPETVEELGEQTVYDRTHGIHETLGYLFFSAQTACIPICHLMQARPEWEKKLIDRPALIRAVGRYFALKSGCFKGTGR